MEQKSICYEGVISSRSPNKNHIIVRATNSDEAKKLLEVEYGVGNVLVVHKAVSEYFIRPIENSMSEPPVSLPVRWWRRLFGAQK